MPGRHWTLWEVGFVARVARIGMTREEVADEIERSPRAVKNLVREMGGAIRFKPHAPVNPDKRAAILNSISMGRYNSRKVADALGVKVDSVRRMIARMVKEGLIQSVGKARGRRLSLTKKWLDDYTPPGSGNNPMITFLLHPGSEVRLATDHPISNGKLGRVVSIQDWGCILETNFGSRRYRAAWNEMEPVGVTDYLDPEANGVAAPVLSSMAQPTPTGNPCPNCQGFNLVRTGACVTCQDCGTNEGCG